MAFNETLFLENLGKETFIENIEWFEKISSSQEVLVSKIIESNEYHTLIGAEEMNSARGQYSREYITSKGTGLYFSIAIPKGDFPNIKQHIKLIMAIAIANSIKKITELNIKIKFPNDIYYRKKNFLEL